MRRFFTPIERNKIKCVNEKRKKGKKEKRKKGINEKNKKIKKNNKSIEKFLSPNWNLELHT